MATYRNIRKVLNLPTLSASPSSGANGEMYFNTGDLALYIYDGAWKKVTQSALPFVYQGSTKGYTALGFGSTEPNTVDKFTFASGGTAASISGDLGSYATEFWASCNYAAGTIGYVYGGYVGNTYYSRIARKFNMSSDTCLSSLVNVFPDTITGRQGGGNDAEKGFNAGQFGNSVTPTYNGKVNIITFSSESVAESSYTITNGLEQPATSVGPTFIVYSGGRGPQGSTEGQGRNLRFTFNLANDADGVTQSSTLSQTGYDLTGLASSTDGYVAGGRKGTEGGFALTNRIEKFSFASDSAVTILGNLVRVTQGMGGLGMSATSDGFTPGGRSNASGSHVFQTDIHKFSYAGSSNATDVGDLSTATMENANCHI